MILTTLDNSRRLHFFVIMSPAVEKSRLLATKAVGTTRPAADTQCRRCSGTTH